MLKNGGNNYFFEKTIMIFLSLAALCIIAPFIHAMDDQDFYDEAGGIVAVPLKKYGEYAAALSEAINNDLATENRDDAHAFSDDQWIGLNDSSEKTLDHEAEEKKRILTKEHAVIFVECERDIFKSVRLFLKDRQYHAWLETFTNLVNTEKKFPSRAAIDIAKVMLENPPYEYPGCELLEYVSSKLSPFWNWTDYYGSEHMNVESAICSILARHFCDTYNRLIEATHPSEPTAPLYSALRQCVRYLASDPDQSWDDIECSWTYSYEFGRRHLKKMAFWFIDTRGVPHQLEENITLNVLNQARLFFETTSYGLRGSRYDLLHLLQERNFICFEATEEQHVWIKYPYQVRIKKTGEVTAALIEEDPLKHKEQYGSFKTSTFETRKKTHEVLKISSDGQDIAMVPAFVKEKRFKDLWNEKSDAPKRKKLMGRAHHSIEKPYFYFERVTKLLQPPSNEQQTVDKKSTRQSTQKKKK